MRRYWLYKEWVRLLGIEVPPGGSHIIFVIPMPDSWPKKKRAEMRGKPHQATPDKDNLEKGLLDAIYAQDKHIFDSRVTKIWGDEAAIFIDEDGLPPPPTLDELIS